MGLWRGLEPRLGHRGSAPGFMLDVLGTRVRHSPFLCLRFLPTWRLSCLGSSLGHGRLAPPEARCLAPRGRSELGPWVLLGHPSDNRAARSHQIPLPAEMKGASELPPTPEMHSAWGCLSITTGGTCSRYKLLGFGVKPGSYLSPETLLVTALRFRRVCAKPPTTQPCIIA